MLRQTGSRSKKNRETDIGFGLRSAAKAGTRANMSQTRRLAAILAADVAGYSRLMGADEETALIMFATVQTYPKI
jgi:class 3 adenylate cyclase